MLNQRAHTRADTLSTARHRARGGWPDVWYASRTMSKRRAREALETLCTVTDSTPVDTESGLTQWVERLRARPDGAALATELLRAYRHGGLTRERWAALTGAPPRAAYEIDDAVRRLWDAFVAAGLAKPVSIEDIHGAAASVRRWAWQPRWILMSQDEDLLLMDDALMPALLSAAAEPGVPRREYALGIVAHHARDTCAVAAWNGGDLTAALVRAASWAPQARAVGATTLAEYLERLGRHAIPAPTDRDGALQRVMDLERCVAPAPDEVTLREAPDGWLGRAARTYAPPAHRLHVAAATGAVTLRRAS